MDKEKAAKNFIKFLGIIEKLRGPDGCAWDKEQTHESLLPYFLEETYEVIESIEEKEPEMFDEVNTEEDFEIPAFLRRQKN